MIGFVLTNTGLEETSAAEIKKLVKAQDVVLFSGRVSFTGLKVQDFVTLCYHGRTFSKVVMMLSSGQIAGQLPPEELLYGLKPYLAERAVVQCERHGEHSFTSYDAEHYLNKILACKYDVVTDYKKPQTTFFLLIDGKECLFGIDFSGIDLGRRDYRIFLGNDSLKGNVAAGVLQIADYQPKHALLDPFCRHGIIPIEAALFATNTSSHKYDREKFAFATTPKITPKFVDKEREFSGTIIAMDDNFKHVSAAQKNAKIAGIVKMINFSRTNLDWLDAKFGKHFLDRIITFPPQPGRRLAEGIAEKIYHQLFYQAEFILKKSGTITLCMKRGVELAKKKAIEFKLTPAKEHSVMQGEEKLTILVFGRA
ncbi:MAG TPA: hypothetical protein VJJ82_05005 [Candidatus Nanoarchaeia archaeon]|nr:hypothetical protein [Candidatus Nanoarchaeia archaeon]